MASSEKHLHEWLPDGNCTDVGCSWTRKEYEQIHGSEPSRYESLAMGVDHLRDMVTPMVAALKADGFTDSQARDIVAGVWRSMRREEDED